MLLFLLETRLKPDKKQIGSDCGLKQWEAISEFLERAPPSHPAPNSQQVVLLRCAGVRKEWKHGYHHERRWEVNRAVGRTNLGNGRREVFYFTGTWYCKWGQRWQDCYRQTEQPGEDLSSNAPPKGHERALMRAQVILGDQIPSTRNIGNGPRGMDPQPRDHPMGVGPNSKEKKARQTNPLQNTNEVFISFSKIN